MIRSVMNIKGGVAKTVTSIQLAAGMAKKGRKCLIIDADGQGNTTRALLPDHNFNRSKEPTLVEALLSQADIHDCIYHTTIENLDIIPAKFELFDAIVNLQSPAYGLSQLRLKNLLKDIDGEYEEVIIDNNPSYNLMMTNTTYAADEIIIPANVDLASIDGINYTLRKCRDMVEAYDRESSLKFKILITMVTRTRIDREFSEELRKIYKDNVYETQIRFQANPVKQASFSFSLLIDNLKANVAQDYRNLIDEVMRRTRK